MMITPLKLLALCCVVLISSGCERIFGVSLTPPEAVSSLTVFDVSASATTLQWTQVNNGASRPASYLVVIGQPAPVWEPGVTPGLAIDGTEIGTPTSFVIENLDRASTYTAYVVAYRFVRDTILYSRPSAIVSLTTAPLPPLPVTDLSLSNVGENFATLSWTQVDDGAGRPANYILQFASPSVEWSPDLGGAVQIQGSQLGTLLYHTVNSLLPETPYAFRIASARGRIAEADFAIGVPSQPLSVTTASVPAPPPPPPPPPPNVDTAFTPNRPAGLQTVAEITFNTASDLTSLGSRGSAAGVADPSAPRSPEGVVRFVYPQGDAAGFYTGARTLTVPPGTARVYIAFNWKLSPEFTLHPANLKLWYFYRNIEQSSGSLVIGMDPFGSGGNLTGGAFGLNGIPQTSAGPGIMRPNIPGAPSLARGQWFHTEILATMNSSPDVSDGRLRVWVNGVLSISRDDVRYSAGTQPMEWRRVNLDPYYGGNTPGHTIQTLSTLSVDHAVVATSTSR